MSVYDLWEEGPEVCACADEENDDNQQTLEVEDGRLQDGKTARKSLHLLYHLAYHDFSLTCINCALKGLNCRQ